MKEEIIKLLESNNIEDRTLGVLTAIKLRLGRAWIEKELNRIKPLRNDHQHIWIVKKSYIVALLPHYHTINFTPKGMYYENIANLKNYPEDKIIIL